MPNMVSTLIEKPSHQQHRQGAQQRHRHHDGRDERVAPVLQEQEHHQEHQRHRFEQRVHHLLDRDLHEGGAVVGDGVASPPGKKACSSAMRFFTALAVASALPPGDSCTPMPAGLAVQARLVA
jgi:hypothetical protein